MCVQHVPTAQVIIKQTISIMQSAVMFPPRRRETDHRERRRRIGMLESRDITSLVLKLGHE